MPKKQTIQPEHKHILALCSVACLVVLFGLVVYPKLAIPAETPSAPTNLQIRLDEENAVITWTTPDRDGGRVIESYSVSYFPSQDARSTIITIVDESTFDYNIKLSDLDEGVEYTVEIRARNGNGYGDIASHNFDVPSGDVPSAPQNCLFTPGDREVQVSCSEPVYMAGSTIQSYFIYYEEDTKGYISQEVASDKDLLYTVGSLANNVLYNFYVLASNADKVKGEATNPERVMPISSSDGGGTDPLEILSDPTVTTTSTTATIHWTTNKEASSIVYYGPTENIKGVSPEQNTTPRVQNHETQITGLISCMTYWFKSESFDADGNSVQSLGGEFKTAGCRGDSTIVASDIKTVTAVAGATASAKVSGKGITAVAPAGIKDGLDIAIEALKLEQDKVATAINSPTGKNWVGDNAYSLKALQDEVTEVDGGFDNPVSVSIDYSDEDLNGYDSNSLKIYHYEDATGWMPLTNCSNEYDSLSGTGTVTCETTSFSVFGLFADTEDSGGGAMPISSGGYNNAPKPQNAPVADTAKLFTKDLAMTMMDVEVKMLQQFLNNNGFYVATSGSGAPGSETEYFGPRTYAALIKFQEKYRNEILTPLGLMHGTGFFGEATRTFVNSLLK